jgi:hypothetical protein
MRNAEVIGFKAGCPRRVSQRIVRATIPVLGWPNFRIDDHPGAIRTRHFKRTLIEVLGENFERRRSHAAPVSSLAERLVEEEPMSSVSLATAGLRLGAVLQDHLVVKDNRHGNRLVRDFPYGSRLYILHSTPCGREFGKDCTFQRPARITTS